MGIKEHLNQHGYFLIKDAFADTEWIADINDSIKELFYKYKPHSNFDSLLFDLFENDFDGYYGCARASQQLFDVINFSTCAYIFELLKSAGMVLPIVNTRPLISYSSKRLAKNDNYWKVSAHQDWPSMQGSINSLTLWIPLVDVTDDLGPLEVAPGTHLNGPLEHDDNGVPLLKSTTAEFVPIPMRAGDVLGFSPFLIHRSGTNITQDKVRRTLHMRYDDAGEQTFIDRKFPHHRIDKRKEGILHPGFPTKNQLQVYHGIND